jgi:ubiquitin-protein ligase
MASHCTPSIRLQREYRDLLKVSSNYWTVRPKPDNIMIWEGNIHGLEDPRHLGKNYNLEIRYPDNYPFRPPYVRFIDKVHCENVYEGGILSVDALSKEGWTPAFSVWHVMTSAVVALTAHPVTGLKNKPITDHPNYELIKLGPMPSKSSEEYLTWRNKRKEILQKRVVYSEKDIPWSEIESKIGEIPSARTKEFLEWHNKRRILVKQVKPVSQAVAEPEPIHLINEIPTVAPVNLRRRRTELEMLLN